MRPGDMAYASGREEGLLAAVSLAAAGERAIDLTRHCSLPFGASVQYVVISLLI